jgi:hypothetical protein
VCSGEVISTVSLENGKLRCRRYSMQLDIPKLLQYPTAISTFMSNAER